MSVRMKKKLQACTRCIAYTSIPYVFKDKKLNRIMCTGFFGVGRIKGIPEDSTTKVCQLKIDEYYDKDGNIKLIGQEGTDKELLEWIYDRLVHVYHENPLFDYMHRLKSITDNLDPKVKT